MARQGPLAYTLFAPQRVSWVLEAIEYRDVVDARASHERIIAPAEAKASELRSAT